MLKLLNLPTYLRPVAQLAEHVTLNHGVEGSIPSGPTRISSAYEFPGIIREIDICERSPVLFSIRYLEIFRI